MQADAGSCVRNLRIVAKSHARTGGISILIECLGKILEEVLIPAGVLVEDQIPGDGPGVQAPGTEVLAGLEAHRVTGRAVGAIIGNGHVG